MKSHQDHIGSTSRAALLLSKTALISVSGTNESNKAESPQRLFPGETSLTALEREKLYRACKESIPTWQHVIQNEALLNKLTDNHLKRLAIYSRDYCDILLTMPRVLANRKLLESIVLEEGLHRQLDHIHHIPSLSKK